MAQPLLAAVLRHVRSLVVRHDVEQLSDRQLLQRFAAHRDETAFATLLRRHGGMVLGVGCRVLADAHAAEDVLQATFLLLVSLVNSSHLPLRETAYCILVEAEWQQWPGGRPAEALLRLCDE